MAKIGGVVGAVALAWTTAAAFASAGYCSTGHPMIVPSIIIKADPTVVWKTIRDPALRKCFHRKVLSSSDNKVQVEDTFDGLPIIGSATCVFNEVEAPCERVEFVLVKSDKLKQFEGYWVLTPINGGKETNLQLNAFCDSGVNLPFARCITNSTVHKFMDLELAETKQTAESMQRKENEHAIN
jgi:hypothetical protein